MSLDAFQNMLIVGVEDGSFQKGITQRAILAAVLSKRLAIEDVKITKIIVDGLDATTKLMEILNGWNFAAIMLAGVSFAGFNVVSARMLHEKFGVPVIAVSRKKPDNSKVKRALQRHFNDWELRFKMFEELGPAYKVTVRSKTPPVYVEVVGADVKWACSVVLSLSTFSRVPEPIRVARLIARGLS